MPKEQDSPLPPAPMNYRAELSADQRLTAVDARVLSRTERAPDVDIRALDRPDPTLDVNAEALSRPPAPAEPPRSRRRRLVTGVVAVALAAVAGGGVWWNRQVSADPGLEFSGGLNVYRDPEATDLSGIERRDRPSYWNADEVQVAFVPNSRLYAMAGLYNGGAHDVRIEDAVGGTMYSWSFDGMSLSTDPGRYTGDWAPFRPFTLRRGETHHVRLEFRLADCDPVPPQPGGYSVLRELRLRYRILGITRMASVPFSNEAIALGVPGECTNPID